MNVVDSGVYGNALCIILNDSAHVCWPKAVSPLSWSTAMLLGMPDTDKARSMTNSLVACEALLLSEYCTRLMCFCALGWTVQFGSLSYTNCRSLTALDRFSTMTWPKPRPAKAEATSGEGSLVGLEQWSCCLRYQSGVVPDPRYSSSFLATGGVQGGFLGRHSFIFISSGETDDTGEV